MFLYQNVHTANCVLESCDKFFIAGRPLIQQEQQSAMSLLSTAYMSQGYIILFLGAVMTVEWLAQWQDVWIL